MKVNERTINSMELVSLSSLMEIGSLEPGKITSSERAVLENVTKIVSILDQKIN